MNRLPSTKEGYTLDLDSTRLLHEDGHQEGVRVGYTRQGLKPCLHPLLAVLAEVRVVAQLWLRPGHSSCGSNVSAFFAGLVGQLAEPSAPPRCEPIPASACPNCWRCGKGLHCLPYVVVAQLSQPIQKLLRSDLQWAATEVAGTEVAEREYQAMSWPHPRRLG